MLAYWIDSAQRPGPSSSSSVAGPASVMSGPGSQALPITGGSLNTVAVPPTRREVPLLGVRAVDRGTRVERLRQRPPVPGVAGLLRSQSTKSSVSSVGLNSGGAWLLKSALVVMTQSKSSSALRSPDSAGGTLSQSNLALIGVAR